MALKARCAHAGRLVRLERQDRRTPGPARTVEHENITYVTINLGKDDYQEFYNGFANRVLWPILHYRFDQVEFTRRDSRRLYARQRPLRARARSDPEARRHRLGARLSSDSARAGCCANAAIKNRIGFFLHIPFPPPEIAHRAAEPRAADSDALCDYDLVGFQTDVDAFNFSRYLTQECGLSWASGNSFQFDERNVRVRCVSDRDRDRALRQDRAARGRDRIRAERGRQPERPRHDHRRRPAGLLQGPPSAARRLRAVPRAVSGLARQGARICRLRRRSRSEIPEYERDGAPGRRGRGPHQRHLRRSGLDADPLRQQGAQPHRARRALSRRPRRRW